MKAIVYKENLPISHEQALIETELAEPQLEAEDILVSVKAIGVNPVDYKVRQNFPVENKAGRVLGWDAAGVVMKVGSKVARFSPGDEVYYSGELNRSGTNSQLQAVNQDLVALKAKSLSFEEAAAIPLTAITAWELAFEHLQLKQSRDAKVLILGAAGGVGSMLIQILKTLCKLTIIATASRDSSVEWVQSLGADHVINHHEALKPQLAALGIGEVSHIAALNGTDEKFAELCDVCEAFGKIALIDDPENLDVSLIKSKSLSLHWEFMFAKSLHARNKMHEQGKLLDEISRLIDKQKLRSTVNQSLGQLNVENLRKAHKALEEGSAIGKLVLSGFAS